SRRLPAKRVGIEGASEAFQQLASRRGMRRSWSSGAVKPASNHRRTSLPQTAVQRPPEQLRAAKELSHRGTEHTGAENTESIKVILVLPRRAAGRYTCVV